jgi:hypothetical protein
MHSLRHGDAASADANREKSTLYPFRRHIFAEDVSPPKRDFFLVILLFFEDALFLE